MKKISLIIIILVLFSMFMTGCDNSISEDITGTWLLTSLQNYDTEEEVEYDEEVYVFYEDGTGTETYLPCLYEEKLAYISWRKQMTDNSIEIKRSQDFSYDIDIIDISNKKMICSYYSGEENETLYLATYTRVPDNMSPFIGAWYLYEIYEDDTFVESDYELLSLYPNGDMTIYYYLEDEGYTQEGFWSINKDIMELDFLDENGEITKYPADYFIQSNRLEMYVTIEDGTEVSYIYKRDYGDITNSPPSTYATSIFSSFYKYVSGIINRLMGDIIGD